ncbi:MAG TPA: LysR family transcriptional regulator [Sphingobium sp.]|nr:LysR family transcriptional regulator [Sphingobium sp.]
MPNFPFTIRQLEVFSDLCTTRSFRRTAENLGVSQASVSSQMKALETQLGLTLLTRSPGRRPSLTIEGRAFLDDLRVFESAGKVLSAHRRNAPVPSEPVRFKLLVGQGLWDDFIRPRLDQFLIDHPHISLDFDSQPPDQRVPRVLEEGRHDFGLLHVRAHLPVAPHMRSLALLRGGVYGHRDLAWGQPIPLAPQTIAQLPFILPRAGSLTERETLAMLEKYDIRPRNVVCHSPYFDVIAAMLDRGIAVASFTQALIPPAMRAHVIQLYPLDDWRLVWFRKNHDNDPCRNEVEAFLLRNVLLDPHYPAIEIHHPDYIRPAA